MKRLAVLGSVLVWSVACLAGEAFIPGTEDVPLMEGLTVVSGDEDVSFDTPAGQILIVEAAADKVSSDSVLSFYRRTLPALGWRQTDAHSFEREAETLNIVVQKQTPAEVQFELAPRDF